MLRRMRPGEREIADALRELTLEHERLIDEGRRAAREKLEEHLKAAARCWRTASLPRPGAMRATHCRWTRTDRRAIALEARIRKVLDDQAARDFAPVKRKRHGARRRHGPRRSNVTTR